MFAPARENANHFTGNLIIKTPTLQKKENSYQGDAIMKSRQQAAPVYALIHFVCVWKKPHEFAFQFHGHGYNIAKDVPIVLIVLKLNGWCNFSAS